MTSAPLTVRGAGAAPDHARRPRTLAWLVVVGLFGACAAPHKAGGPAAATGPAPPQRVCQDFSFPIYFETSSDRLTDAARLELTYAAQRVRGCRIDAVEVVGLSDATGRPSRNLSLSRARARAVTTDFAALGLPSPRFRVEALGGAGALSPDGDSEPLRRRADVVIRASEPPPDTGMKRP